jgi:Animal haem peroxidase
MVELSWRCRAQASEANSPKEARMSNHHGAAEPRGLANVPHSELFVGRFGRMFRSLPPFAPSEALIERLAAEMVEPADPAGEEDSASDNPTIPAGFTYVGQFLDHDLTFDPVSSLQHQNDPNALTDFRTPRLDLDSVYGSGPGDQPFLYDTTDPVKLLIGRNPPTDDEGHPLESRDLPRNQQHRALIGDKRNDENTIISQLQLTFLDFHNQVVDDIRAHAFDEVLLSDDVFAEAQRLVRWHYQWAIAFDFLPRIVGHELVDELIALETRAKHGGGRETIRRFAPARRFYRVRDHPFMPVEFSVGAYRYGHSQIRPEYDLNDVVQNVPIFVEHPETAPPTSHLGGFRALPQQWTIDWSHFFDLPGGDPPEKTRLIDTRLALPMTQLPSNIAADGSTGKSLAFFNLLRGKRLGLPSGQAVAQAIGANVLSRAELGFDGRAPLWYYVLKEAEVQHNGRHLGETGGRIIAEVILALIDLDGNSFLRQNPAFMPVIDRADPATFTFSDVVAYAVRQRAPIAVP